MTWRYWLVVTDRDGKLQFRVTEEGLIEFGTAYTPAKTKAVFESTFQFPENAEMGTVFEVKAPKKEEAL